ncbi:hypothetical protein DAI22_03g334300 [Oryza sativa Japonica Group]|nr:hypothetical protein DAI22_03g334300 [Oryza sativa Japonica Group]
MRSDFLLENGKLCVPNREGVKLSQHDLTITYSEEASASRLPVRNQRAELISCLQVRSCWQLHAFSWAPEDRFDSIDIDTLSRTQLAARL